MKRLAAREAIAELRRRQAGADESALADAAAADVIRMATGHLDEDERTAD